MSLTNAMGSQSGCGRSTSATRRSSRYDNPENIAREPSLLLLLAKLLGDYPELRDLTAGDASWQRVITLAVPSSKEISPGHVLTPEIIISGIPRSGTSYLCHLLHCMSNCVALNEPPEAIPLLRNTKSPLALANFLRDRRRDVLLGVPIANKVEGGQIIQDTAKLDKFETYTPQVDSPNFVLGIKETLPFLTRLPMLRQIFPAPASSPACEIPSIRLPRGREVLGI